MLGAAIVLAMTSDLVVVHVVGIVVTSCMGSCDIRLGCRSRKYCGCYVQTKRFISNSCFEVRTHNVIIVVSTLYSKGIHPLEQC